MSILRPGRKWVDFATYLMTYPMKQFTDATTCCQKATPDRNREVWWNDSGSKDHAACSQTDFHLSRPCKSPKAALVELEWAANNAWACTDENSDGRDPATWMTNCNALHALIERC